MDFLKRVIGALEAQTLDKKRWDAVVVDNGSRQPLVASAEQDPGSGIRDSGGNREFKTPDSGIVLGRNMRLVRTIVTGRVSSWLLVVGCWLFVVGWKVQLTTRN